MNYPKKAILTILTFLLLGVTTELIPALEYKRFIVWNRIPSVIDFESHKNAPPVIPEPTSRNLIEQPGSLDTFFAALRSGKARVIHYGDSPTAADQITADVREILQKQFGDAGHGFVLIDKPWAWYNHRGVSINSSGWTASPITGRHADGLFGLGGVRFRGEKGAHARIGFATEQQILDIYTMPGEGTLKVRADGREIGIAAMRESPFHSYQVPFRTVDLTVEDGVVEIFGISAERASPGILYSSLGLNGADINVLRQMAPEHWSEQLQHYRPDLVVINYGTNASVYSNYMETSYEKELREAISRIRSALPQTSILIMSPMDRGARNQAGTIETVPGLLRVVHIQQRVAASTGCAFFNTFDAMGGPGTMARWYAAEPRLVTADFIHPMPSGARAVGNLLASALLEHYRNSLVR